MKKFLLPVSVIITLFILVACVSDKNLDQLATNGSVLNAETTIIEENATQESTISEPESTTQEAVSENETAEIIDTTKEYTTEKQTDAVVQTTQKNIEQTTIPTEKETTNITTETKTNISKETTTIVSVDIISKDEAKKIVLKHTGLSETDISSFSIEIDREITGTEYDIDFRTNEYKYEYKLDAKNGNIIKYEKETIRPQTAPETTTDANISDILISEEQVKQIVLNHSGFSAEDIRNYHTELDREITKTVYDVDFNAGEFEYEYEIDATNGNIIKSEKERID